MSHRREWRDPAVRAAACLLAALAVCPPAPARVPPGEPAIWMGRKDAWPLANSADWPFVKKHLDGSLLYIDQVKVASTNELMAFAAMTREAGIDVIVECGGLVDWRASATNAVGASMSAELSFADEFAKVRAFVTPVAEGGAGGRIAFLQLDGPIRRMLYPYLNGQRTAPAWHTVASAVEELIEVMRLWRGTLPDVQFFLLTNFPNWGYASYPAYNQFAYTGLGPMGWGDYREVVGLALRRAREEGIPIFGVTADNPLPYADGTQPSNQPSVIAGIDFTQRIRELEDDVRSQGARFCLIFNSNRGGDQATGSDQLYHDETLAFIDRYRGYGGAPDVCGIQSWYYHPTSYLPESQPHTMTYLLRSVLLKLRPWTREAWRWDFETDGDTEGWVANARISGFAAGGGLLRGDVTGPDPWINTIASSNLNIPIDNLTVLEVRMRNATPSTVAQVYFQRAGETNYTLKNFSTVADDSGLTTYRIDMAAVSNWNGTLTTLRLDPTVTNSGSFEVDYVVLMMPETYGGLPTAWTLGYFKSIRAPEAAPGADADGDGLSNVEEHAFMLDAARGWSGGDRLPWCALDPASGRVRLSHARPTSSPAMTIAYETSRDLIQWDPAVAGDDYDVLGVTPLGGGAERIELAFASSPPWFVRLRLDLLGP